MKRKIILIQSSNKILVQVQKLPFSLLYNDDIWQESSLLVYMLTSNSLPCLLYVKHYPRISQFSEEVQYVDVFDVKLKPAHCYQAGGGGVISTI